MRLLICLALTSLLSACGGDDEPNGRPDASNDTGRPDTGGGDTGMDARDDARPDARPDGDRPDVGPDGELPDATPDADGGRPTPTNHRAAPPVCSHERATWDFMADGASGECQTHDDCNNAELGTNGRCGYSRIGTQCSYDTCFADSDCSAMPNGVCACEDDMGATHCQYGGCVVDSDCGEGGYCSPSFGSCGNYFGVIGYWCHTQDDECTEDSECTEMEGTFGGGYCAYSEEVNHWVCQYSHCAG